VEACGLRGVAEWVGLSWRSLCSVAGGGRGWVQDAGLLAWFSGALAEGAGWLRGVGVSFLSGGGSVGVGESWCCRCEDGGDKERKGKGGMRGGLGVGWWGLGGGGLQGRGFWPVLSCVAVGRLGCC